MSNLFSAVVQEQATTANGAKTLSESLNKCVDFFFLAGAMRGKDITPVFAQALAEDEDKALRIMQWMRDVRGGAGERKLFRDCLQFLEQNDRVATTKLLEKIPEIGRFDDLLVFNTQPVKLSAFSIIKRELMLGNGLCAKWMPRKGPIAKELTKFLELTPKQYRKTLVTLSKTVEQQMCAQDWDNIEFGKVPSLAAARYQKAFSTHTPEKYEAYRVGLENGTEKISAAAVYPYDIVKSVRYGDNRVANQQWKALPNYMEGCGERILPVVDVSGSMSVPAGGQGSISCMDVAISLGLYISERNEGIFKDQFITFSQTPQMHKLSGTLSQRVTSARGANWDMNTNLQATFDLILNTAIQHNLTEQDLPTKIVILSDMEFNRACGTRTNFEVIRAKYEASGFKMPELVFWNLNGRQGNVPVKFDQSGTALVSGFSPAIMKSLLGGELHPQKIMDKAVMIDRYKL